MTGTILYRTPADTPDEALNIADNWLSMFLAWHDPGSGEDYDIDGATAAVDGTDEETRQTVYAVRTPITYTDATSPTLLGFLESNAR